MKHCSILIEKVAKEVSDSKRIIIVQEMKENQFSELERCDISIVGSVSIDLADKIRNNPNVKLFIVREANRDRLVPVVLRLLSFKYAK